MCNLQIGEKCYTIRLTCKKTEFAICISVGRINLQGANLRLGLAICAI